MHLPRGSMAALLAASVLLLTAPAWARDDDKKEDKTPPTGPLERKALDAVVFNTLRDVINRGVALYNYYGDAAGCYHLYEGSLMTVRPLLDHRPGVQKTIDTALTDARRAPSMANRAWTLRKALDKVRDEVNPKPNVKGAEKSLWERLGGEKGVTQVVDEFVAAAAKDPKVNFFRDPKVVPKPEEVAALKRKLVEQISSLTGGPFEYKGKSMKEVHKGMGITDAEFDALAGHLERALKDNKVQPADVKTILGAVGSTRKDIVEKKEEDTGEVAGTVTLDGKPLAGATVAFHPDKGDPITAKTQEDGTYKVGAVKAGRYRVTVSKEVGGKQLIPARYSDPAKSTLEAEVKKGKQPLNFELKSK
jgi:hemoglobin